MMGFGKRPVNALHHYEAQLKRTEDDIRQRVETRTRLATAVDDRRDLVQERLSRLLERVSAKRRAIAAELSPSPR